MTCAKKCAKSSFSLDYEITIFYTNRKNVYFQSCLIDDLMIEKYYPKQFFTRHVYKERVKNWAGKFTKNICIILLFALFFSIMQEEKFHNWNIGGFKKQWKWKKSLGRAQLPWSTVPNSKQFSKYLVVYLYLGTHIWKIIITILVLQTFHHVCLLENSCPIIFL